MLYGAHFLNLNNFEVENESHRWSLNISKSKTFVPLGGIGYMHSCTPLCSNINHIFFQVHKIKIIFQGIHLVLFGPSPTSLDRAHPHHLTLSNWLIDWSSFYLLKQSQMIVSHLLSICVRPTFSLSMLFRIRYLVMCLHIYVTSHL